jgi:hypothetical protein
MALEKYGGFIKILWWINLFRLFITAASKLKA